MVDATSSNSYRLLRHDRYGDFVVRHLKAMTPAATRKGTRVRSAASKNRIKAPPLRARPISFEASRANLWQRLARDPTVSKSVGLVL